MSRAFCLPIDMLLGTTTRSIIVPASYLHTAGRACLKRSITSFAPPYSQWSATEGTTASLPSCLLHSLTVSRTFSVTRHQSLLPASGSTCLGRCNHECAIVPASTYLRLFAPSRQEIVSRSSPARPRTSVAPSVSTIHVVRRAR